MYSRILMALGSCLLWAGMAVAQLNINTATLDELDGLKGIGPTKAQAIIDYRKKNGPFKAVDDLQNVPGIWPATLKDIRKEVMVTGTTRVAAPSVPANSPAREAAKPVAPATPATAATLAKPAAPAMPGKPASLSPPAADRPAAPAAPAVPAKPAMPSSEAKAAPALPMVKPAAPAPAVPLTKPAAPAAPAMPAKPAQPAASY